jgi:hypothetical protein
MTEAKKYLFNETLLMLHPRVRLIGMTSLIYTLLVVHDCNNTDSLILPTITACSAIACKDVISDYKKIIAE